MQRLRGRNECVGIDIKPAPGVDPRPLLSSELRRLRLGEMVDTERRGYLNLLRFLSSHWQEVAEKLAKDRGRFEAAFVVSAEDLYAGELATGAANEVNLNKSARRGGRPGHNEAFYEQVAATYKAAWFAGKYPRQAVADAGFGSKSAAAKWISTCRDRGLLPPTSRGLVSGMEPDSDIGEVGE